MRPIKLIIQAFGPFADRQEIDFRNCLDQRLFGFYGETGGGKTSILDGMCFALFGESSGSERKGEDLRSHHVGPEIETVAEFIFEVGSKRFFIRRSPQQTVKAKRGGGETSRAYSAQLFDATGLEVEQISIDNCGTPLAERVGLVNEKVAEILGYLAPQFRQVVLLPQGQFRELLTAKSDERSKILRRLFDVSIYEKLVEALKTEERTLDSRVREGRQLIGSLLSQHGAMDTAALSLLIEAAQTKKETAEAEQAKLQMAHVAARNALTVGNVVEARFTEHTNARVVLEALLEKEPKINLLETRLVGVQQATSLSPLDARAGDAAKALQDAEKLLDGARASKTTVETAFEKASIALRESLARQSERDELAREVSRLEEIEQRISKSVPIREEAKRLHDLAEIAKAMFSTAETNVANAERALVLARNQEAGANTRQSRISELPGAITALTSQRDEANRYALAVKDAAKKESALGAANDAWEGQKSAANEVEAAYRGAEEALSMVQAVHLASKLIAGEPCSVCGSTHHPSPAVGDAESRGLNKAFEDARASWQSADKREREAQARQVEAKARCTAAAEHLSSLLKPQTTVQDADAELSALSAELSKLKALPSVTCASALVSETDIKWREAREALDAARVAKDSAVLAANAASQRLTSALEGIDEALQTKSAIDAGVGTARAKSTAAISKHEGAVAIERKVNSARDVASAAFLNQSTAYNAAALAAQKANSTLKNAIAELGWTEQAYVAAKGDIGQQDEFLSETRKFREDVRSAKDRHARAEEALQGVSRLDLRVLTDAAENAERAAQEAVTRLAEISAKLAQQEQTRRRCKELGEELRDAEAEYAIIGELKDLTSGANDLRMSLADYAVAATFEDVLEAANVRFTRMSRGRFALQRRREVKDGRARAGLEIVAYDAYTDRLRDAHTLSGGESFMAALSLALGLSDVVQQRAGGIKLDVIFIDEGFGSLDEATLDNALLTLREMVGNNRAVGVISHVETVKQQIQAGFDISKGLRGSRVTQRATH